jgi:hypothetical protein
MTEVILKPISKYKPPKPTVTEEDETVYLVHNITGKLFFATGTEIMIDMAYGCFIDKYCEVEK